MTKCRATICRIPLFKFDNEIPPVTYETRPASTQLFSSSSSALNLRRLFALRNFVIVIEVAAVFVVVYGLNIAIPVIPLATVIGAYAFLNALTWARLKFPRPVTEAELFAQLLMDVLTLAGLLYFTGGSTNPFISLFLLPLIISAAALPGAYTWAMAAATVACYSIFMVFYLPLPHAQHSNDFALHVLGMWFGFFFSAGLIAFFVVKMANTLRERDRMLAAAREQALRHERVLALATLAAGAAHELGTPLSTMAVIVKELDLDPSFTDYKEQLQILRDQIQRCKGALSILSASAGETRAEAGHGLPLDNYLAEVIAEWRRLRATVTVHCHLEGVQPAPHILAEQTLTQALMIILNNAADASPESVEVKGQWTHQELLIEVQDRGRGLAPDAANYAGHKPFFTTKAPGQGLGLGLFLAHTTISRFGGKVTLSNREDGGACTRLVLPLSAILTAA